MIRFFSLIYFAFRDASKSKILMILIILSLSVAFAAMFISSSVFEGFNQMLAEGEINWLGHIVISPKSYDLVIPDLEKVKHELSRVDNIESFSVRSQSVGAFLYQGKNFHAYRLLGVDTRFENIASNLSNELYEGNFIDPSDPKKIVLGLTLADAARGFTYDRDRVSVGEEVEVLTMNGSHGTYKIGGIVDAKTFIPNWLLIMPKEELEKLDNREKDSQIIVKLKNPEKIEETKNLIKEKNLNIEVIGWREQAGYVDDIMTAVSFITVLINRLLTGAVFVIIAVIIFMNVFNRKRQIGILKSMGVSNKFVISVYIIETFFYAFFSYLVAFVIFLAVHSYSASHPVSLLIGDFHTIFNEEVIWSSLLTLFGAALGGSFIPAYIAAKTKIIDVLRGSV